MRELYGLATSVFLAARMAIFPAAPTPTVTLDLSPFLGTDKSTFTTARGVTTDSQGNLIVIRAGDIDPNGYPGVTKKVFGPVKYSNGGAEWRSGVFHVPWRQ